MTIEGKEDKIRLKLYNKGLSDKEIAEKLYLDTSTITAWRRHNKLSPNPPPNAKQKHKFDTTRAKELYDKGMNDIQISTTLDINKIAIRMWRNANDLPVIRKQLNHIPHDEVMKLYNEGLSDGAIARQLGLSSNTIVAWRKRNNLEPNFPYVSHTIDYNKVRELYDAGELDTQIAKKLDISYDMVVKWRKSETLQSNREKKYLKKHGIDIDEVKEFEHEIEEDSESMLNDPSFLDGFLQRENLNQLKKRRKVKKT